VRAEGNKRFKGKKARVSLGLRRRAINLGRREQTSHNGTTQAATLLCVRQHRTGGDSYRKLGPRKFAEVHQLNIRAIVARMSAKAFIRVGSGTFVGRFGGQEYALGSTEIPVARAIRRLSELRREIQAESA
jgi:hypothetical protein